MNKSALDIQAIEKIYEFSKDLAGIFTTADLYQIFKAKNPIANQRAIARFVKAKILTRVQNGIYVLKKFNLEKLAQKLFPESYQSLESILMKNGLIGTLRLNYLSIVTYRKKNKKITVMDKTIKKFSLKKNLYFGFEKNSQGIFVANSEKAFLDLLYFYNFGEKFPFDPKNEISVSKLNNKKISSYLKKYRNLKFVKFVKGILNG